MGLLDETASNFPTTDAISFQLAKLRDTLAAGRSRVSCLRRWSEFIRERDGHRCVDCHSREKLSAHHICRKSFLTAAQFDTGNGITLCRNCHKEMHSRFNGRPNLSLPVDAQGGEKLALMERLFSILVDDAIDRGLMREEFYFLSDEVLGFLKWMQEYDGSTEFPGSHIEQAYLILAETERQVRQGIAEANGFVLDDRPLLPNGMILAFDADGRQTAPLMLRGYLSRSPSRSAAVGQNRSRQK